MSASIKVSDTPLFDQPVAKTEVPPFTVTALTRSIKNVLESAFTEIIVEGEISGFSHNRSSGHRYWTLKDEGAQISCTFWKSRSTSFEVANGQKVICRGRLSLYAPKGSYQLDVYQIRPVGIGVLQLAYEKLFQKLNTEGLFEVSRKRAIPKFPGTIGVVTSADGAAFQDIVTAVRRRYPLCKVLLRPAAVQGIGAELQIAQGIRDFNLLPQKLRPDVLIVGRGGGSLEDLWCFNEEAVARAIFSSSIPVISAVGHEVDVTIADFVADLRAPTPTAAAELATQDRKELADSILGAKNILAAVMYRFFDDIHYDLEHRIGVKGQSILSKLNASQQVVDRSRRSMLSTLQHYFEIHKLTIAKDQSSLAALNPLNILDRGYALIRTEDGHTVGSIKDFPAQAEVLLKDGSVKVRKA
jgi:exodeoxyribonuclease VII large subunit